MAYTAARAALQQYADVPVSCSHCGASAMLLSPSGTVRDMLMNASYLNMFQQELDLLHRTQALFSRFPMSRHPLKIGHEQIKRFDKGLPDEALEGALAEDPELHEFLTNGSFLLSRRLEFIVSACTKLEAEIDSSEIRCGACADGRYLLEAATFFQVRLSDID